MTEPSTKSIDSQLLGELLAAGPVFTLKERLVLAQRLAVAVHALHGQGRTHRALDAATVTVDGRLLPKLAAPAGPRRFGAEHSDPEFCPPELALDTAVELPAEIETAAAILRQHGLALDPRRVDVYQFGVLLCQLLTGESLLSYRYSTSVKAKVPPVARAVLDRCLGEGPAAPLADCNGLIEALEESLLQCADGPPSIRETPPRGSGVAILAETPPQGSAAAAPAARSAAEEPPFERLGHFQIVQRIGHGGMGDVYKGYDSSLDRHVAIKVLPATLARDEDFVRRFHVEAAAAAKLAHPNVVPIHFIGQDAGHYFFAMQFIEGESLGQQLVRQGRLPLEQALAIVEQCLAGLEAAHAQGLVHRDVKPGNILLDRRSGQAVLVDFGLVRQIGAEAQMTATGVVMGTVDYIAPEQARGQPVDGRSDIYSLGVMFYQMLAGRLPFHAETPTAMIFQHAYEEPFPLKQAAPDVPQPVLEIIARMMAKDPDERYRSCAAVLADLKAFREGRPLEAAAVAIASAPVGGLLVLPPGHHVPMVGGIPPKGGTTNACGPDGSVTEGIPVSTSYLTPDTPWQRAKDWAATMFRRHAPAAIQELQNTTQQADAAVAEHERRTRRLTGLLDEARGVVAELAAQIGATEQAALDFDAQVASAANPDAIRDKLRTCQEDLAALRAHHDEQLAQVVQLEADLNKTQATLARLRSQRDLLNARMKAVEAQQRIDGNPPSRRTRFRVNRKTLLAVASVAALVLGAVLLPRRGILPISPVIPDSTVLPIPPAASPATQSGTPQLGPGGGISGFGGDGTGWTLNVSPTGKPRMGVSDNVLTLTTRAAGGNTTSLWCNTKLPVVGVPWTATFTYSDVYGGGGDGAAFVLQTSPSGVHALGGGGGEKGVTGIAPSVEIVWNIFRSHGGSMVGYSTGGGHTATLSTTNAGVDITRAHTPTRFTVSYDGTSTLDLSATQEDHTFSKTFTGVNLGAALGNPLSGLAYVGFTGAAGGITSTQQISNFSFNYGDQAHAPNLAVAPFDPPTAKKHQDAWAKHVGVPVEITNSIGMKLMLIPPGEFQMGSPQELIDEELKGFTGPPVIKAYLRGEGPRHLVQITRPFFLGKYDVTQEEYQKVMGANPSNFSAAGPGKDKVAGLDTKHFPVETVSWNDAVDFCNRLSAMPAEKAAGRRYRLPTEAQWEYACRAGNAGRYSFSSDSGISRESEEKELLDYAWFDTNSGQRTHEVGGKRPNAWGLYDMHGNVSKWCMDLYDDNSYSRRPADDPTEILDIVRRVYRGGGWDRPATAARSARRDRVKPEHSYGNLGFRVLLALSGDPSPPVPTITIILAHWGREKTWSAVTARVRKLVANGTKVWANVDSLKVDPAPGKKKQLHIAYMKDGQRKDLWVDEGKGVNSPDFPQGLPAITEAQASVVPAPAAAQPVHELAIPPAGQPPLAVAPFDAAKARQHQDAWAKYLGVPVEISNSIGMKLVLIPPGEFQMGSSQAQIDEYRRINADDGWYKWHLPGEMPQHRVRITKAYRLGATDVTQEQYQRVMGGNPSKSQGDPTRPVEQITWDDAVEFCRKLSGLPEEKAAKRRYEIPTEAQWEYACCRAVSSERFGFSLSATPENSVFDHGWFDNNSGGKTHAVGGKLPNTWGLYDMHGNVANWCRDWYDGAYYAHSPADDPAGPSDGPGRVVRGGSYRGHAQYSRTAFRKYNAPQERSDEIGLRVAVSSLD